VADAVRYAARFADVISCSWSGPVSPDLEFALQDVQSARGGRGAVVVAASGNEELQRVEYPASDPNAIGVGACTDADEHSWYSNAGRELSVAAPSDGGELGIYTTDVSIPNRGFNVGTSRAGDARGFYTNDFGGTSAATPLVAGIAALMLSKNARLERKEVKAILEATARKIGADPYDRDGFNVKLGHGCVDASAALEHALTTGRAGKKRRRRRR